MLLERLLTYILAPLKNNNDDDSDSFSGPEDT